MSTSLRDLKARVDALPTPGFDADLLFRQAESRMRRRQTAAWVAVGVVVALIGFGAATLRGWTDHSAPPAKQGHHTHVLPTSQVRHVTFGGGYWPTTTIHYGDRTVDLPQELSVRPTETGVVHMDVTDDGVAFTIARITGAGRGVWFTDGVTTNRIGRIRGYLGIRNDAAVVSGTAGSRVAWIEASRRTAGELVVYDTHADREVTLLRLPPACGVTRWTGCALDAFVGDNHVYFVVSDALHRHADVLMRLDVSTGTFERVTTGELAADRAGAPRGLIVGESPETGVVSDGYGTVFAVKGDRLVPMREHLSATDPNNSPSRAFDTGTDKQLWFRPPTGSVSTEYTAFEWLDDDRLVLMNAANTFHTNGEILVCQISTGRCDVVVAATPNAHDDSRPPPGVVPHLGLPG